MLLITIYFFPILHFNPSLSYQRIMLYFRDVSLLNMLTLCSTEYRKPHTRMSAELAAVDWNESYDIDANLYYYKFFDRF